MNFNTFKKYIIHINAGGGILIGRDNVLKEVRNIHQTALKGVSRTMANSNIKFVAPGVAIANVVHNISRYKMPKRVNMRMNIKEKRTYL